MSRPKQSAFMGHKYRLEWVPKLKDESGTLMYGITNHDESLIQIDEGLNPDRERETLLHEIIHQMLSHSGLNYEDEAEESLASFLGNAILHHMEQNRGFWRYLMQRERTKSK